MTRALDSSDRRILAKLQANGDLGPGELSELIGLSMSQCSRRLQRLRAEGYVRAVVSLLDPAQLNTEIIVFVRATLKSHAPDNVRAFRERVELLSEITECHMMTGDADYLLKICTRDLETYNRLLTNQLVVAPEVAQVRSSIVLESLKYTTELPLEFI